MVWSVLVLLLLALAGGAVVGLLVAFVVNAVIQVVRSVGDRSA